ncbi:unnamed protein product [Prunus brigantina]
MWARILISRDLPYGLMVNKGSNYHCGGELYYPAAAGYQLGFIQSIPIPPMDSVNLLSSWRVEFKDAKEVTTLTNFNQDLMKSFSIPIRDPRFGDSNIFIHWWKEMSAGCSPCPAGHPSSSHSIGAVQSATTPSATPRAIFGLELSSADTTAIEVEFQPLFAISSGSPLTRPLEAPQSGPTFHADVVESTAITIDHAIITNGAPFTIPTDGSAPPKPVLMLTSGAPTLVVDAIPSELQLEIGESSSFVPAEITMNPSTENGRRLAMVPHEKALLSSPDQASSDIFDFLDQWDASIFSTEASTHLATSSTSTGALPDSEAEALLRSYRDGDLISLEDKNERTKLKAAIETLASSGFFPDPRSAAMITYLFSQVEKFTSRYRPFLEEQKMGQDLEQGITSCSATMRREIEIARQMQQEAADIHEWVRQLQERKAGIIAKVSEIVRSNRPLKAQLRQDEAAVGEYGERKLMIQSTLSAGDTGMESFRTALRALFPDA